MIQVRLLCCPLCGAPLFSTVNGVKEEHVRREGFSLNYVHYPAGFASSSGRPGYAERIRFSREVCVNCGEDIRTLMEPIIRLVHDKEVGR